MNDETHFQGMENALLKTEHDLNITGCDTDFEGRKTTSTMQGRTTDTKMIWQRTYEDMFEAESEATAKGI